MQAASPRALLSRVVETAQLAVDMVAGLGQPVSTAARWGLGCGPETWRKPGKKWEIMGYQFLALWENYLKMLYYSYHEVVILNLCVFLGHWKKHHMVLCSLYIPSKLLIIWFMFMDVYGGNRLCDEWSPRLVWSPGPIFLLHLRFNENTSIIFYLKISYRCSCMKP